MNKLEDNLRLKMHVTRIRLFVEDSLHPINLSNFMFVCHVVF